MYLPNGLHVLVNGKGDESILDNESFLHHIITKELRFGRVSILKTEACRFSPQGVTIFFVLEESHASIHTYPEHGAYMMDIFTCGNKVNPVEIAKKIASSIGPDYNLQTVERNIEERTAKIIKKL